MLLNMTDNDLIYDKMIKTCLNVVFKQVFLLFSVDNHYVFVMKSLYFRYITVMLSLCPDSIIPKTTKVWGLLRAAFVLSVIPAGIIDETEDT